MFVEGLRENKYVVQIHQTHIIGQARHNQFHDSSKLTGSVGQTETKNLEAPLPLPCDKGSLVAVALINLGLPVPPLEVACREEFAPIQRIKAGVNFGQLLLL